MSVWCPQDLKGFATSNIGQINLNTDTGKFIYNLIRTNNFRNLLEIGTWNGMGSTKCILEGLKHTLYEKFISLETNKDKVEAARKNLKGDLRSNDTIVWGTIISPNEIQNEAAVFTELNTNEEYKQWHVIDCENMSSSPNIFGELPTTLDFVLFDGGEFTTYWEFMKIKDRCTGYILLDDVNTSKCRKVRELLNGSSEWTEVYYTPERNGFACFQHTKSVCLI